MNDDTERIEREVHEALSSDTAEIANRVRDVTIAALSKGKLDAASLREVSAAVIKGAQQGVERPDADRIQAIREAVRGLDEALAAAAHASTLAVKEALGRGGDFTQQEMRATMEELGSLESNFLHALADSARSARGLVRTTLHDLAEHGRTSGTAVGSRVKDAAAQLTDALADLTRAQVESGVRTLRNETGLIAALAAGFLRGLADRLHPGEDRSGTDSAPSEPRP